MSPSSSEENSVPREDEGYVASSIPTVVRSDLFGRVEYVPRYKSWARFDGLKWQPK